MVELIQHTDSCMWGLNPMGRGVTVVRFGTDSEPSDGEVFASAALQARTRARTPAGFAPSAVAPSVASGSRDGMPAAHAAPADVQPVRAARKVRGIEWGCFSIAPIFRDSIKTGFGATCKLHHNDTESAATVCKKTLSLGDDLSDAQAILYLKRWLLLGLDMKDQGSAYARWDHRDVDARRDCAAGVAPGDLDQVLATKWEAWPGLNTS
jgi:hypothetical protein